MLFSVCALCLIPVSPAIGENPWDADKIGSGGDRTSDIGEDVEDSSRIIDDAVRSMGNSGSLYWTLLLQSADVLAEFLGISGTETETLTTSVEPKKTK
jgi:hypothetical protein